MKIYKTIEEVKEDIKDNKLEIDDDVSFEMETLDIKEVSINARNINAWNINVRNINARNINAWDISARNINAGDINAWDINVRDINAWNINAWDINYYAIAFAYKNIKCKSIKGRRENSKHFVLDGELKIKNPK